jgi:5-hydroxyisourate hydrolase
MARISTHVLDVERGRPVADMTVELYFEGALVGSSRTNANGRTDEPLQAGGRLSTGFYECVFHAGDYLSQRGEPAFYDRIAIRFRVSEAEGSYHVPLLLAAHGYSTYRGS